MRLTMLAGDKDLFPRSFDGIPGGDLRMYLLFRSALLLSIYRPPGLYLGDCT